MLWRRIDISTELVTSSYVWLIVLLSASESPILCLAPHAGRWRIAGSAMDTEADPWRGLACARMEKIVKRAFLVPLVLLLTVAVVVGFFIMNNAPSTPLTRVAPVSGPQARAYLYYTLKESAGFVLARAAKGPDGQPLGQPQQLLALGDEFGLTESDSVSSMQLSPDGLYLAIDGIRDHGEQVWIYNTQTGALALQPAYVSGNFLHWLPGGHTFLYRPMLPLGPDAPMDNSGWHPGLWTVDAASGAYRNIELGVPSADLVDAVPSPDGSHIVYSVSMGLGLGSTTFVMQADGRNRTVLFSIDGGTQAVAGLFAWSPDSSRIAYERLSDSSTPFLPASLWLMDRQGGQQERLTTIDGGHGYAPSWSPDGTMLAYVARTNIADREADVNAQALQSAIGVVNVATHRSWLVASPQQTGQQLNINPIWSMGDGSITFTSLNAINRLVGGTPRYWSAPVLDTPLHTQLKSLTSPITHVIAFV